MAGMYITGGILVVNGLTFMYVASVGTSRRMLYGGIVLFLVGTAFLIDGYNRYEHREDRRRGAQIRRLLALDYPNLGKPQITDSANAVKFHGGADDEATCWPWVEVSHGKLKFTFEREDGVTSSTATCKRILAAAR